MLRAFDLGWHGAIAVAALAASACSSDSQSSTDLPAGWEGAKRVSDLMQLDCAGSPYDGSNEHASFVSGDGSLAVNYSEAHFRCQQAVVGFFRTSAASLDVLVQPVDMHPTAVARCDCLYEITMVIEPVSSGSRTVTLFRRWDDWNEPNDPLPITSELVTFE